MHSMVKAQVLQSVSAKPKTTGRDCRAYFKGRDLHTPGFTGCVSDTGLLGGRNQSA